MKKFKLVLAALTLASSLAFAEFTDVPSSHWANEAVINLQSKGLLAPSVGNSAVFNGDGVFSRYEVASMLYLSLNNTNESLDKKASKEDLEAMQLLVKNFSPELTKMGAKVSDIEKKLADLEKKGGVADAEKRLDKKIAAVADKFGKVSVKGDLAASQTIGMQNNNPGMEELKYKASISIVAKPIDAIEGRLKLQTDQENRDTLYPQIKAVEIKGKTNNGQITVFRDGDKKVASFENTLGMFSGNIIDPDQGVIANGTLDIAGNKNRYVAMFYQTKAGDFYGIQTKQDLDVLAKMQMGGFIRASYAEKILGTKYQYDSAVGRKAEDAKGIYSVDGQLDLKNIPFVDLSIATEIATRRSPTLTNVESEAIEYMPVIGAIMDSRNAVYMYTNGKIKGNSGLGFSGGLYNSGEYFDLQGMGDTDKTVFAETGLIKSESNKKALMGRLKYDLMSKGILTTALTYSSYGENVIDYLPAQRIESYTSFNVIPNKIKMEFTLQDDKEERMQKDGKSGADGNEYNEVITGDIEYRKEMLILTQKNTFNFFGTQYLTFAYRDNVLKNDKEDADKYASVELGHEMDVTKDIYIKADAIYRKDGLGLKNFHKWKFVGGVWNDRMENKEFDKRDTIELGSAVVYKPEKLGTITVGGKYKKEDKLGGLDIIKKPMEDSEFKDDKEEYNLFARHQIDIGKWTFTYGAKYLIQKEGIGENVDAKTGDSTDKTEVRTVDGTAQPVKYYEFRDKKKSEGGEYELLYALGVDYSFDNDTKASFTYGDTAIREDNNNFMADKTSFADGEQDQFRVSFSTKF